MERKIYTSMIVVALVTMFISIFSISQLFYNYYTDLSEDNLRYLADLYTETNTNKDINLDQDIKITNYYKDTLPDKKEGLIYHDRYIDNERLIRVSSPTISRRHMIFSILSIFISISIFIIIFLHLFTSYLADELMLPIKVASQSMEDILEDKPISDHNIYPEFKPFISNINSSREQIQYYIDELEKNEEFKRELTANVSHELKTPLTSINGYAELLKHGLAKDEDIQEIGSIIHGEGERLLELIEDIIDLSKLDKSESEVNFKNIDLFEITKSISEKLTISMEKKDIDIILKGKKTIINANERMIRDLVYNLIDNSIKYNINSGSIHINIGTDDNIKYLEISDTGIGIEDEDLERIFDRFYMANKSRTKTSSGTGLGLSIVKNIVNIHNGEIEIKSEINKGTLIKILFK